MKLIDGRSMAAMILTETSARSRALRARGISPRLAVVVPNDDEATAWYVRSIVRAAKDAGVECQAESMPGVSAPDIAAKLESLSRDPSVHGIICQTPLPKGVSLGDVGRFVDPVKDVDGANPESLGSLAAGRPAFAPATAAAVLEILHRERIDLEGTRVVVVGRSTVVGKPAALLLLAAHATVTVCHSRTRDLAAVCSQADVLVAAVGKAKMLGADFIRPGAVVIDVGTNPVPGNGIVGDVDQEAVAERAGAITPVPGGVGPVTTALLLRHVIEAAEALGRTAD